MKKNLTALVLVTIFTVACNPGPSTNPTSSTLPSGTPSSSVQPSGTIPSVQPSGSTPVAITCNPEPTLTIGQEFDKNIFSQLTCNTDAQIGSKSGLSYSYDIEV